MTKVLRHCPQMGWLRTTKQSTPSPSLPFKVFAVICLQKVPEQWQNIACKEEVGGKRYFPLFMFVKRQKGPLGQRVSANFVADCWFSMGKKINKPGVFRNLQILIIKMTSLVTMKICTMREEVYKYDWLHLLVKIDNIGLLKLKLPLTSSLLQ